MEQVDRIDTVGQYNNYAGVDTLHPLVSIINFEHVSALQYYKRYMGVYAVFLKDINCGNIVYGCQSYDYEDGTLVFIAPGQVYGIDSKGVKKQPSGYALVFHPDLIVGTSLAKTIKDYSFFSYEVNEALHLSKKERNTIVSCLEKITSEIEQNIDQHSKTLIVSNIELLLNYCQRYYDRQFITRSLVHKDVLTRFENLLDAYFQSEKCTTIGVPTVRYCAEELNFSVNYFGDLIKKETGQTALDLIQSRVIEMGKSLIVDKSKSIGEISYKLGFKYQQHFTRLFKQRVGLTPNQYRSMNV